MSQIDLIAEYRALELLIEQMHRAAIQQDWDQVFEIELLYADKFEAIKIIEASQNAQISVSQQQKKAAVIQQILTKEQAVKAVISPAMTALEDKVKTNQTQVKLNNTYVT